MGNVPDSVRIAALIVGLVIGVSWLITSIIIGIHIQHRNQAKENSHYSVVMATVTGKPYILLDGDWANDLTYQANGTTQTVAVQDWGSGDKQYVQPDGTEMQVRIDNRTGIVGTPKEVGGPGWFILFGVILGTLAVGIWSAALVMGTAHLLLSFREGRALKRAPDPLYSKLYQEALEEMNSIGMKEGRYESD